MQSIIRRCEYIAIRNLTIRDPSGAPVIRNPTIRNPSESLLISLKDARKPIEVLRERGGNVVCECSSAAPL